jgi:hypothetical protein
MHLTKDRKTSYQNTYLGTSPRCVHMYIHTQVLSAADDAFVHKWLSYIAQKVVSHITVPMWKECPGDLLYNHLVALTEKAQNPNREWRNFTHFYAKRCVLFNSVLTHRLGTHVLGFNKKMGAVIFSKNWNWENQVKRYVILSRENDIDWWPGWPD